MNIANDRIDLFIVKYRLPGRHRCVCETVANDLCQMFTAHSGHDFWIGQIPGMGLQKSPDPIFTRSIGCMAKGAILLEQRFAKLFYG